MVVVMITMVIWLKWRCVVVTDDDWKWVMMGRDHQRRDESTNHHSNAVPVADHADLFIHLCCMFNCMSHALPG